MSLYKSYIQLITENTNKEKIEQLLFSQDVENQEVAFELIKSQGLNPKEYIVNTYGGMLTSTGYNLPTNISENEFLEEWDNFVAVINSKVELNLKGENKNPQWVSHFRYLNTLEFDNSDFDTLSFDTSKMQSFDNLSANRSSFYISKEVLFTLKRLTLTNSDVETHGIDDNFFENTPNLEYLSLMGMNLSSVPTSLEGVTSLKGLDLRDNENLTDVDLGMFKKLDGVKKLLLKGTGVYKRGNSKLQTLKRFFDTDF